MPHPNEVWDVKVAKAESGGDVGGSDLVPRRSLMADPDEGFMHVQSIAGPETKSPGSGGKSRRTGSLSMSKSIPSIVSPKARPATVTAGASRPWRPESKSRRAQSPNIPPWSPVRGPTRGQQQAERLPVYLTAASFAGLPSGGNSGGNSGGSSKVGSPSGSRGAVPRSRGGGRVGKKGASSRQKGAGSGRDDSLGATLPSALVLRTPEKAGGGGVLPSSPSTV